MQDRVRAGLNKSIKRCPTCGNSRGNLRSLAKDTGVSPATLCRFLNGAPASGDVLDKLDAYLWPSRCPPKLSPRWWLR